MRRSATLHAANADAGSSAVRHGACHCNAVWEDVISGRPENRRKLCGRGAKSSNADGAGPYNGRMPRKTSHEHDHGLVVETSKPEVAPPPRYQVLLLNDDYTPMDFVVTVLQQFFNLDLERATQVMLHVHTRGRGVCGVYSREVAESKVAQVNEFSRMNQHPLLCTMEQA